jgi:hypothetical protein
MRTFEQRDGLLRVKLRRHLATTNDSSGCISRPYKSPPTLHRQLTRSSLLHTSDLAFTSYSAHLPKMHFSLATIIAVVPLLASASPLAKQPHSAISLARRGDLHQEDGSIDADKLKGHLAASIK